MKLFYLHVASDLAHCFFADFYEIFCSENSNGGLVMWIGDYYFQSNTQTLQLAFFLNWMHIFLFLFKYYILFLQIW